MNPYVMAASAVVWLCSMVAAALWGMGIGQDRFSAQQLREEQIVARATEAAASAAADAISKIEVKNTVINHELQREVQTKTVYRDCRSGADAVRMLNDTAATEAGSDAAAGGRMPKARTAR